MWRPARGHVLEVRIHDGDRETAKLDASRRGISTDLFAQKHAIAPLSYGIFPGQGA